MTYRYKQVDAVASLPPTTNVYEAQTHITCANCAATIAPNTLFSRRLVPGKGFQPHCRTCKPFTVYADEGKTRPVAQEDEWMYCREVDA